MSYKLLDHATDAVIEITASNLKEAFTVAGQSAVDITLDSEKVEEKEQRSLKVIGKDLRYLLFNWLEEVNYQLITEGFAIHRFELDISKNSEMYFVHSFFIKPENKKEILATTCYGNKRFCSVIKKDNIYGVQFHPEKSGLVGLKILDNFGKI